MKNKIKNIRLIFMDFILLIFFAIGTTSSRYLSTVTTEDDIIAKSILTLKNEATCTIENLLPGGEETYEFSVLNYDEVNTNEVLMKYYFEITIDDTKIPLEASFQNVNTGKIFNVSDGRTDEIELPYGSKITTNYKLILKWDKSKSDVKFAGQDMECIIKLVATQKNG